MDDVTAEQAQQTLEQMKKALGAKTEGQRNEKNSVVFSDKLIENLTETEVRDLLDNAVNGAYDNGSYIPLRRNTPQVLIDEVRKHSNGQVAVENLPVVMNVGIIRQVMEEDTGDGSLARPHGITQDGMIEIIKGMDEPAYIVFQRNRRYAEVVCYYDHNGRAAIAALDFGGVKHEQYLNGYEAGNFNVLVTTFNPDNLQAYLSDGRNTVIYDKTKGIPRSGSGGILTPSHSNGMPFKDIVAEKEKAVNTQKSRKIIGNAVTEQEAAQAIENIRVFDNLILFEYTESY